MTKLLKIAVFSVPASAMLALTQPASAADRATAAAAGAASAASVQAKASETKAEWADEGLDLDAKK
jgi:hypothetical protein